MNDWLIDDWSSIPPSQSRNVLVSEISPCRRWFHVKLADFGIPYQWVMSTKGVFLLKTMNAIIPAHRVNSVNLDSREWKSYCSYEGCCRVSSQRPSRFERATRSVATLIRSHCSLCSVPTRYTCSLCLRLLTLFTGLLTLLTSSQDNWNS